MKKIIWIISIVQTIFSLQAFSQNAVYTIDPFGGLLSGGIGCNGSAMLDTTNVDISSIVWMGSGTIYGQNHYETSGLCPGAYSVSFVANGTQQTLNFTIEPESSACSNFVATDSTTNVTQANNPNGTITILTEGGIAPISCFWANGANTLSLTGLDVGYYKCVLVDAIGCKFPGGGLVWLQTPYYGDTLIFNNSGTCSSGVTTDTLSYYFEDCNLNYNLIDTAFLATTSSNSLDSIYGIWTIIDSNGISTNYYSFYYNPNGFTSSGCLDLQLIVYCTQKSMDYKNIIVNQLYDLELTELNELSSSERSLIQTIDLMGKETQIERNKVLVKCYSDGTKEKVFISE